MGINLNDLETRLKSFQLIKKDYTARLIELRDLKGKKFLFIDDAESTLYPSKDFLSFNVSIDESFFLRTDYEAYIKTPVVRDSGSVVKAWEDKQQCEPFFSLVNQTENVLQEKINAVLSFTDELKKGSLINPDSFFTIENVQSSFYDTLDFANSLSWHSELFEQVETHIIKRIHNIIRRIIYTVKINTIPFQFYLDKRTQFRQIIKFLFKNLDDSHGSLNNSALLKNLNYLLNKNFYEKGIFRATY